MPRATAARKVRAMTAGTTTVAHDDGLECQASAARHRSQRPAPLRIYLPRSCSSSTSSVCGPTRLGCHQAYGLTTPQDKGEGRMAPKCACLLSDARPSASADAISHLGA